MPGGKYRAGEGSKPFADDFARQPEIEQVRSYKDIATEARTRGLWIYDPTNRCWYSPEEFLKQFERVSGKSVEKQLAQMQIIDPLEGVKAGNQKINDLQKKLEDFTWRLINYFRQGNTKK